MSEKCALQQPPRLVSLVAASPPTRRPANPHQPINSTAHRSRVARRRTCSRAVLKE